MAAGKHIGKVLLRIRQEEDGKGSVPSLLLMQACPRYHCNPACTYIITGTVSFSDGQL
jgi:fatty acid synthase